MNNPQEFHNSVHDMCTRMLSIMGERELTQVARLHRLAAHVASYNNSYR